MGPIRVAAEPCPRCGHTLDADTALDESGGSPSPGDLSVCLYCATIHRFGVDLKRRPLSNEEIVTLPDDMRAKVLLIRETILAKLRLGI
jgi:hypothetical protein